MVEVDEVVTVCVVGLLLEVVEVVVDVVETVDGEVCVLVDALVVVDIEPLEEVEVVVVEAELEDEVDVVVELEDEDEVVVTEPPPPPPPPPSGVAPTAKGVPPRSLTGIEAVIVFPDTPIGVTLVHEPAQRKRCGPE